LPQLPAELAAAAATAAAAAAASGGDPLAAVQRLAAAVIAASNGEREGTSPGADDASRDQHQSAAADMKVPPISLPTSSSAATGGLPHLPFSPDLLWRYPNPFLPQPPPSPLESQLKAHLPGSLGHDPRTWSREDVAVFLRFCEREFDLEQIDMDKFQMNGEYIFLLNILF